MGSSTGLNGRSLLELKRISLEAALGALPNVRCGDVNYLILADVEQLTRKDVDRLPFVKRSGFAAEEEYRIILESDEPQTAAQSIELPINLIGGVYLNPWLPKSIADSVITTVRNIPGCAKLTVRRSYLIDSARWKEAGDRVVGLKTPKAQKPLKLPKAKKR